MKNMDDLQKLADEIKETKEAKGIPEFKLKTSNFLFLDVSSSCTGFAIAEIDFTTKIATITKAGCIWFPSDWEHAKKFDYIYNAIQIYFDVVEKIDYIVIEQYSVNMKNKTGMLVSPEMHGVIKAAAFSNGVKVAYMPVQTWRHQLNIKPIIVNGKKDYKTPCKDLINTKVAVPEEIISNITKKLRKTPSDVYDALGICWGWLQKNNIKKIIWNSCDFGGNLGLS